jgi:adenine-specific DNA-methyltransferase
MPKKPPARKTVAAISHSEDKRKNIPTAEFQSVVDDDTKAPKPYTYPRNTDLDPQLVWRERTSRTGPTWWFTRRLSTFRKRFTPRY